MYETQPSRIADEWVKKYKNTYVFVKGILVYASGYDGKFFTFTDEGGQAYKMLGESKTEVTSTFPDSGAFSFAKGFLLFHRVPARQYKKAPNSENCCVFNPIHSRIGFSSPGITFKTLAAAFEGHFYAPHALFEEIFGEKRIGGAISRQWAMEKHPTHPAEVLLFFKDYPVATITKAGVATVVVPSFTQEVHDFNRDFAVGLKIA